MRTIIIRILIIAVAVLLQTSFLNLLFAKNLTIDILPLIALIWVIIVGFEKIWLWIVALGIFADLFLFERVGISVIFFIGIAYAISFFSRRFLIEKKLVGFFVIVLFIIISFLLLDLGKILISENFSITNSYINIKDTIFSFKKIVVQNILNILFFYILYFPINKIEKNIKNHKNKISVIF